jgi:hypothetical protein
MLCGSVRIRMSSSSITMCNRYMPLARENARENA